MVNSNCGYCYLETPSGPNGTCVSAYINNITEEVQGADGAEYGPCSPDVSDHSSHLWAYDYCPTSYSWMALFGLILYLAFFAPGQWMHVIKANSFVTGKYFVLMKVTYN